MSAVLVPLSILLMSCVAAILFGLIDCRAITELANSFKQKVLFCLTALAGLAHYIKAKDSAGQSGRSGSFDDFVSRMSSGAESDASVDLYAPLDMDVFNCRVLMKELREGDNVYGAFGVEICGSIHAPLEMRQATLRISISDVTDGSAPDRVLSSGPQARSSDWPKAPEFIHVAELGRLPHEVTRLEEWTAVARLRTDGQVFPRRGRRMLKFSTSILSADGSRELAGAGCKFAYENPMPGYLDLQENDERTKVLTVALAFAVSAADNKLYECEIEPIKRWARENVLDSSESNSSQSRDKLEKALSKTIAFFSEGNKLDVIKLCEEVVEIAPVGQRYETLELCLRVAGAKGSVNAEEMAMLMGLGSRLEVDPARFRALMQKILPIDMHEFMDTNDVLGITSDMSREKTRKHLNQEYSKWNSRVTSPNPEIQSKADQMLKLIAEARGHYVAEGSACNVSAARR